MTGNYGNKNVSLSKSLSFAVPTRRVTSQSFLVTRRDGQFWKQKYFLVKIFITRLLTRRVTSQSFFVTRRDGQFWKQKYFLVKIFVIRRAHTASDRSKFFERVWENFCSQKFSHLLLSLSLSLSLSLPLLRQQIYLFIRSNSPVTSKYFSAPMERIS